MQRPHRVDRDRRRGLTAALVMDHTLDAATLSAVAGSFVVWGLISARVARWQVTAPIAFVVFGFVATHGPWGLSLELHSSTIRTTAELTLALVLFSDASRVRTRTLAGDAAVYARLLGIGLPLTIAFGAAVAVALFSSSGVWVAVSIGAIVAPTDAALGAPIMLDERVPSRVRTIVNVESGLNDGIATPFVNLFLAWAVASEVAHAPSVGHAAVALLGGAAVGAGAGLAGGVLLTVARRSAWSAPGFQPLAVLALAVLAYCLALGAGVNGFVAAFVAGFAFGAATSAHEELLPFTEEAGTLLSLVVWFAFGAVMLVPGLKAVTWREVVFALLALTVVRMVPVAVSLMGSGFDRATVVFVGWFGPRGLASVIFGLIAVDSLERGPAHVVLGAVVLTVGCSVVAHGVSASPLAAWYGARAHRLGRDRPEHTDAIRLPVRQLSSRRHRPASTVTSSEG